MVSSAATAGSYWRSGAVRRAMGTASTLRFLEMLFLKSIIMFVSVLIISWFLKKWYHLLDFPPPKLCLFCKGKSGQNSFQKSFSRFLQHWQLDKLARKEANRDILSAVWGTQNFFAQWMVGGWLVGDSDWAASLALAKCWEYPRFPEPSQKPPLSWFSFWRFHPNWFTLKVPFFLGDRSFESPAKPKGMVLKARCFFNRGIGITHLLRSWISEPSKGLRNF